MPRRSIAPVAMFALAVAVTGLLAGCVDGGGLPGPTPPTSTTSTAPTATASPTASPSASPTGTPASPIEADCATLVPLQALYDLDPNLALLDDPTRPPEGIVAADGSLSPAAASGLTSVMMPKKGRPSAIIDGQLVQIGGSVRNGTLVRLTENSAVLEGAEGTERLYLTPDVEKKTNVTRAAVRRQRE